MRSTERGWAGEIRDVHRVLAGADAKANFAWGLSALEVGDLSLLEHGCKRRGANGFDPIGLKTTNEGRGRNGRRASLSRGADKKRALEHSGTGSRARRPT